MKTQQVHVTFNAFSKFIVPDGIDLNNKDQVEDWWIKWNTLCIQLKGQPEIIKVDAEYEIEIDSKYPNKTPEVVEEDEDEDSS